MVFIVVISMSRNYTFSELESAASYAMHRIAGFRGLSVHSVVVVGRRAIAQLRPLLRESQPSSVLTK